MSTRSLAFYVPDGRIAAPTNPYGRHVANAGTFRALAQSARWQHIHVQSRATTTDADLAHALGLDADGPRVSVGTLISSTGAAKSGTLLSGQAYLSQPAWTRRQANRDGQYSIVGTLFAFSSPRHRELMVQSLLAPVHEWDAIICSSPSLRSTVIDTIDRWEAYLRQHLGAPLRLPRPQLPIIGFGTDVGRIANLAADGAARVRRRTQLGIGPDEVMIFSLGRLSYVDKAFPQAMFKAVHQAQQEGTGGVHFVMAGWFSDEKADRDRYQQAAERYCPQVRVSFIDGNDQQAIGECWAAADVFLLLSDTIIETFGQALVEAMAAGLPLVVSDWDGYRWIVRDRVDGFLIPTLGAAPGPVGEALAMLEYTESIGYAQYSGAVSAHTAVDVMAAGAALSRLIASPALRRELGEAARSRAQQHFDWPVIVDQYARLFDDLAERRAWSEPAKRSAALNPLRDDPFASFRLLPTAVMTDEVTIRRGAVDSPDPGIWLDMAFPGARGTPDEAQAVLEHLQSAPQATVSEVLRAFPAKRRSLVRMTLSWLAKSGAISWSINDQT